MDKIAYIQLVRQAANECVEKNPPNVTPLVMSQVQTAALRVIDQYVSITGQRIDLRFKVYDDLLVWAIEAQSMPDQLSSLERSSLGPDYYHLKVDYLSEVLEGVFNQLKTS